MGYMRPYSTSDLSGSLDLREREKELDFIYSLAALLSSSNLHEHRVASESAELFRTSLSQPELAKVTIRLNGIEVASFTDTGANRAALPLNTIKVTAGESEACLLEAGYFNSTLVISDRELSLAQSAVRLLAISARRMLADRYESELKLDLERKNATLSELLSRIELEKKGIRTSIAERLMDRILPILARMDKAGLASFWSVEIRRELENSVSGTVDRKRTLRSILSNRELEICALVADGLSSKEIALRLGLAATTIERHRYNARKKLGLPTRQGSLGSVHLELDL